MELDKILNIYQTYTAAKISAFNKQILIAQYTQCQQIGILKKQIENTNNISRRILENQLKEIQHKEKQTFYKCLAFKMNEAFEKISSIPDINLQTFFCSLVLDKILVNIKESQDNLDEISDKEYCKKLQNKCNTLLDSLNNHPDYLKSALSKMLNSEQDYKNKIQERNILLKKKKNELVERKKHLENTIKKESIKKKGRKGCVIASIGILCLLLLPGIIVQINDILTKQADWKNFLILLIIFLILLFFILKYYRKQNNPEALLKKQAELDQLIYNVSSLENEINNIENEHSLKNHTYIISKKTVEIEYPNLENDLLNILKYFSIEEKQEDLYDKLLKESAEFIISFQKVSTATLQRKFSIGYNRANSIMEQLADIGVVGDIDNNKHREVLLQNKIELDKIFKNIEH